MSKLRALGIGLLLTAALMSAALVWRDWLEIKLAELTGPAPGCAWLSGRMSNGAEDTAGKHAVDGPNRYELCRVPIDKELVELSEFQIRLNVRRSTVYYFDIDFAFNGNEEEEIARRYAGDAFNVCDGSINNIKLSCGIKTNFNITIEKAGFSVAVPDPLFGPQGSYAYDDESFSRNLITVRLDQGSYTIRFKKLHLDTQAAESRATVVIRPSRH